jgi:hypothetical protein
MVVYKDYLYVIGGWRRGPKMSSGFQIGEGIFMNGEYLYFSDVDNSTMMVRTIERISVKTFIIKVRSKTSRITLANLKCITQ